MPGDRGRSGHRARRWGAGAAFAALVVAAVAWWPGREAPPAPEATGAADALAANALRALAQAGVAADVASGTAGGVGAAASAMRGDDDPTCPPSWKALTGLSGELIERAFRRARPGALRRASALLAASQDPFERVVGRLLADRARQADGTPSQDTLLMLVSEALSGSDARVTGLAAQLCDTLPTSASAACSSLTPAHWAMVDPTNVQPWVALAAHAQRSGDAATVREAMARAALAQRNRLAGTDLIQLARSPALQALEPSDRQTLVIDLLGVSIALSTAGVIDVSRLCPSGGMGALRQGQCSDVAGVLVAQGESLVQRGVGIDIGRRAGWDAERVAALESENKAMIEALGAATLLGNWAEPPMTQAQSCEVYHRVDAVTRLIASDNEAALARRALQQARAAAAASAP